MTKRLLAPIAVQDNKNNVVDVDLAAFVRRVLLFETYILQSVWLEDLALLARAFNPEGLIQLFEAGALKIYCESYTIGETGRVRADLNFSDNNKRLPLGSYSFSVIRAHEQEKKIQQHLSSLGPPLQEKAAQNLITINSQEFSPKVFEGFYNDIRQNQHLVQTAVNLELRRQGIKPKRMKLRVEEVEKEDFRVENNLVSEYGLSEKVAHEVIGRSLLAVSGLNQRFAEMMTHSALSGITEEDMPLMRDKLGFTANFIESNNSERQFERVTSILDLPIPLVSETKIDAEKLLKIRDSDECRAFRDWLARADSLSDKEISERVTSFNSKIRVALNSKRAKVMRFLVSNGVSFLPPPIGTVAGLAVSAIDSFLVEKLAPKDAIVSFLSESYPSVLKEISRRKHSKR